MLAVKLFEPDRQVAIPVDRGETVLHDRRVKKNGKGNRLCGKRLAIERSHASVERSGRSVHLARRVAGTALKRVTRGDDGGDVNIGHVNLLALVTSGAGD